jgi:hypothetical protein
MHILNYVNSWVKKDHVLLTTSICSSNNIHEFEGEVQAKPTTLGHHNCKDESICMT